MVSIKEVRAANQAFKASEARTNLVALFVGATSGIGLGTVKQFAANTKSPKIYLVGRSKNAAQPLLQELATLNPDATIRFIETEISLIKNVDAATEQIKAQEDHIDLLFLTAGYLSFEGRKESTEGIDIPHALRYYSRLRFVDNLLPLLNKSQFPRVVSVLAGGKEAELDFTDLEMKNNFNVFKAMANGATQTTLAFEELAKTNPNVTFIHKFPGLVSSGLMDRFLGTASGLLAIPTRIAKFAFIPFLNLVSTSVDVAGERGLFIATDARFAPSVPKVKLDPEVIVAKNSHYTGEVGNGVYLLNENDDSAPDAPVMPGYRADGSSKKVWDDTQLVWGRALSSSAVDAQ